MYDIVPNDLTQRGRRPVGTATVSKVYPLRSLLRVDSPSSFVERKYKKRRTVWYVRLKKKIKVDKNPFNVYSDDLIWLGEIHNHDSSLEPLWPFDVVNCEADADLVLTKKDENVCFTRGKKCSIVPAVLPPELDLGYPIRVSDFKICKQAIGDFAAFTAHLVRSASAPKGQRLVRLSMKKLHRDTGPEGEELIGQDNIVNIVVDPALRDRYGLMIQNTSGGSMFVSVLAFNPYTAEIGLLLSCLG